MRVIRGNSRLSPQSTVEDYAEQTTPSVEERVSDDATLAVLRALGSCPRGSAAHAAALRGASPRLPDHRRDARPTYREHRADQARCLERLKRLLPPGFNPKEGLS